MRIYALVSSWMPLTCWLYRQGFCRFSSARYSSAPADLENSLMHLTNVAIQKKSDGYSLDPFGGKWDLRHLKLYLMSRHGPEAADKLFKDIELLILRSLVAVKPALIHDKRCFELYGYDVLFSDDLKPWLVEVNASPSLTANTKDDEAMKVTMLAAMLDIIDLEGDRTGDEVRIGGFDLVYNGDHVSTSSQNSAYTTMLGCEIPAERVQLASHPEGQGGGGGSGSGGGGGGSGSGVAVKPALIHDKRCFELYGYDVLFSDDLKPWHVPGNKPHYKPQLGPARK
eukprot:CAMPEP_0172645636 /NCGR_PEP_ID=MMETSP1068-20121228/239831_1 /TAXON_ID=35684 /ORGANISM="Pseudopedinella elastica, Strain CCMP716" /LENGTH=282 /DNA_ID=CAMNT_0013459877 /DNA_START=200 /DNA_END=1048 /DNA_ORIENTATION=-